MEWFANWWESLEIIQQVYACIAIPATVILVLQTLLLLFGLGGSHDIDNGEGINFDPHDINHDISHDLNSDHDSADHLDGLRIFTIRGIIAFLSIGGWLGVSLIDLGISPAVSSLFAFLGGSLSLIIVALILKASLALQDNGNISLNNAIGCEAQVYITIPSAKSGTGKVTLMLQERFVEVDAMTESSRPIKTGLSVIVTQVVGNNILMVMPQGAEIIFESTKQYVKNELNK